jgi:peroxiredoxin
MAEGSVPRPAVAVQWRCLPFGQRIGIFGAVTRPPASVTRVATIVPALTEFLMPVPAVGAAAPDFTLNSTSGSPVTLSQFKGTSSVLLAFFPLAFTSVCTAEMCAFTDDYGAFEAAGVTVLPISVDSVPTLKEFKAKYNISVDMLSDFKREASRAYGTLLEALYFSNRAYFLIGIDGVVRWAHVEENPGKSRTTAEILAAIAGT